MWRTRCRIWLALMLRDIRSRRGRTAESFLLSFVEPVGQLLIVYVVFTALGRKADFGDSLFLFLLSGVLPYFLFTHVVGRIMGALRITLPMLPLGTVGVIDVAIAQLVVETLIVVTVGAGLLFVAWLVGLGSAVPADGLQIFLACIVTALAAFGVGLFNAAAAAFLAAYRLFWTLLARSLLFFSSVFYVIDTLPPNFRDTLWWNPLLHGVVWFRSGFYGDYPVATLSYVYMIGFTLMAILMGLSLVSLWRRRA
jgi:capsular polysaccharide transport system permease protein